MDIEELRKIIELMNEHGLTHFKISTEGFHLKLKKGQDLESLQSLLAALPAAPAVPAAPAAVPTAHSASSPSPGPASSPAADGEVITSPMVGTFYRKSAPDAPNLVNPGDAVSEGQTLCIIEAMKVMNEITADRSGVITAVLVEEGSAVQFGDELFRIK